MSRSWVRMGGALAPPRTRLTHGALTSSPMGSMAGLWGVHRVMEYLTLQLDFQHR